MPPILQVPIFARLDEYVGVWAIDPTRAAQLWEMVHSMKDLQAHVAAPEARAKEEAQRIEVPGGKSIAVLKAEGVMMKQRASFGRSTSTIELRRDLRQAANDPDIGGILLAIDSPGGTFSGMEELASEVRAARAKKPIYSFVEDLGASAAYWLASQTERIHAANQGTMIGSIGTIINMYDVSGKAEKEGVKALVFATGPLKGTGTPGAPVTEEQQAYLQGIVNQSQVIFDDAVRGGRGFNEQQLSSVKTGGVFLAGEAQTRGLIDGVQSFDATVQALASRIAGKPAAAVAAKTSVLVPKTHTGVNIMTFEQYLAARGLAVENLSETTLNAMRTDWEALKAKTSGPDDDDGGDDDAPPAQQASTTVDADIAADRKKRADENRRVARISEICGVNHAGIAAEAIEKGWSVLKTENAVLKASQRVQTGPGLFMGSTSRDVNDQVIRAALCLRAGLREPEKSFTPQVLEAAEKHCAGWGIQRVMLYYAQRNGWSGDPASAFQLGNASGLLKAAFSTIDLSNTLGGSSTMFARQGIRGTIGDVWRMFSRIVTVNDFKPTDGQSLIEGNTYEEVGADGEIKHGTLGQSSWTNRIKSYAKMLSITFQDLRNDSLGFLANADRLLGRGAARAILKEWFKEFMDNASFFTSGNGNYASGSGTALSATSLATAEALFRAQTTEEGDAVDFDPAFVVTPLALDVTARELFQSTTWNTGGASSSDRIANENIWAGMFQPVTASQLSNSTFTGYSTKAWYLLADPADAPVMEVAFLDGRQVPIIETAQADFNTLGSQMRGHIHFGCKKAEYRAGVKMKGEA